MNDGGYMIAGLVISALMGMMWESIRSIDTDGDGKINYGSTAIFTMDTASAGFIIGSVSVNQGYSNRFGIFWRSY